LCIPLDDRTDVAGARMRSISAPKPGSAAISGGFDDSPTQLIGELLQAFPAVLGRSSVGPPVSAPWPGTDSACRRRSFKNGCSARDTPVPTWLAPQRETHNPWAVTLVRSSRAVPAEQPFDFHPRARDRSHQTVGCFLKVGKTLNRTAINHLVERNKKAGEIT
jgi:hypothetical protein